MSHLNLRFPPELLAMDNEMEAFWEDYKRQQEAMHTRSILAIWGSCHESCPHCGHKLTEKSPLYLYHHWTASCGPQKLRITEEPLQMLSDEESKLSKWARAWLKVAKGIIR